MSKSLSKDLLLTLFKLIKILLTFTFNNLLPNIYSFKFLIFLVYYSYFIVWKYKILELYNISRSDIQWYGTFSQSYQEGGHGQIKEVSIANSIRSTKKRTKRRRQQLHKRLYDLKKSEFLNPWWTIEWNSETISSNSQFDYQGLPKPPTLLKPAYTNPFHSNLIYNEPHMPTALSVCESEWPPPSIAICITGAARTFVHPLVHRSMRENLVIPLGWQRYITQQQQINLQEFNKKDEYLTNIKKERQRYESDVIMDSEQYKSKAESEEQKEKMISIAIDKPVHLFFYLKKNDVRAESQSYYGREMKPASDAAISVALDEISKPIHRYLDNNSFIRDRQKDVVIDKRLRQESLQYPDNEQCKMPNLVCEGNCTKFRQSFLANFWNARSCFRLIVNAEREQSYYPITYSNLDDKQEVQKNTIIFKYDWIMRTRPDLTWYMPILPYCFWGIKRWNPNLHTKKTQPYYTQYQMQQLMVNRFNNNSITNLTKHQVAKILKTQKFSSNSADPYHGQLARSSDRNNMYYFSDWVFLSDRVHGENYAENILRDWYGKCGIQKPRRKIQHLTQQGNYIGGNYYNGNATTSEQFQKNFYPESEDNDNSDSDSNDDDIHYASKYSMPETFVPGEFNRFGMLQRRMMGHNGEALPLLLTRPDAPGFANNMCPHNGFFSPEFRRQDNQLSTCKSATYGNRFNYGLGEMLRRQRPRYTWKQGVNGDSPIINPKLSDPKFNPLPLPKFNSEKEGYNGGVTQDTSPYREMLRDWQNLEVTNSNYTKLLKGLQYSSAQEMVCSGQLESLERNKERINNRDEKFKIYQKIDEGSSYYDYPNKYEGFKMTMIIIDPKHVYEELRKDKENPRWRDSYTLNGKYYDMTRSDYRNVNTSFQMTVDTLARQNFLVPRSIRDNLNGGRLGGRLDKVIFLMPQMKHEKYWQVTDPEIDYYHKLMTKIKNIILGKYSTNNYGYYKWGNDTTRNYNVETHQSHATTFLTYYTLADLITHLKRETSFYMHHLQSKDWAHKPDAYLFSRVDTAFYLPMRPWCFADYDAMNISYYATDRGNYTDNLEHDPIIINARKKDYEDVEGSQGLSLSSQVTELFSERKKMRKTQRDRIPPISTLEEYIIHSLKVRLAWTMSESFIHSLFKRPDLTDNQKYDGYYTDETFNYTSKSKEQFRGLKHVDGHRTLQPILPAVSILGKQWGNCKYYSRELIKNMRVSMGGMCNYQKEKKRVKKKKKTVVLKSDNDCNNNSTVTSSSRSKNRNRRRKKRKLQTCDSKLKKNGDEKCANS